MANPQKEHGHIRIANTLWEAWARIRIAPESERILKIIIRQTWGYGKKSAMITLDKFAVMSGLGKPNVIRAIKKLYQMNLIVKNDNGKYSFQKDFDKWKPLSKMTMIVKNDNNRCQKRQSVLSKMTIDKPLTPLLISNNTKSLKQSFKDILKNNQDKWFNELYKRYPRKIKTKLARGHFNATIKTEQDYFLITSALDNYIQDLNKNKTPLKYVDYASTWFNNWQDWIPKHPVKEDKGFEGLDKLLGGSNG